MTHDEVLDFVWSKITAGNYYMIGPTGGLIVAPPVEKIADWYIELQQKEPK